jgi:hypothetical protein
MEGPQVRGGILDKVMGKALSGREGREGAGQGAGKERGKELARKRKERGRRWLGAGRSKKKLAKRARSRLTI